MRGFYLILVLSVSVQADDIITADPDAGASAGVNLSGTDLTTKYCRLAGQECEGDDLGEVKVAAMPSQCLARCSHDLSCMSAYIDESKGCHLRSARCDVTDFVAGSGDTYHRLKKSEKCPTGSEEYVEETKNYSNSYCMVADKACPGHNLYAHPQQLKPYLECLKKCSKIKACGMVDFHQDEKQSCEPMAYQCTKEELVDAPGTVNYIRLEKGVTECSGNHVPAGPPAEAPRAPDEALEPNPEPEPEPETEPESEAEEPTDDTEQTDFPENGDFYIRGAYGCREKASMDVCGDFIAVDDDYVAINPDDEFEGKCWSLTQSGGENHVYTIRECGEGRYMNMGSDKYVRLSDTPTDWVLQETEFVTEDGKKTFNLVDEFLEKKTYVDTKKKLVTGTLHNYWNYIFTFDPVK